MGEDIETELADSINLVGHVQIADVPGRHGIDTGTGTIDWALQLATLDQLGYRGAYGLEYQPTVETAESLIAIETIATAATVR